MKALLLTTLLASAISGTAMGQIAPASLEETKTCVMVYVKHDASQPNLTVACDGNLVLSHKVRTEENLENPVQFRAELYTAFQSMVNSTGRKVCSEYDDENIWWASCYVKQ